MIIDGANETDVREEIASPFLSSLGYERGTNNDIHRELPIKYGKNYLGRKKNDDPPLRGRADYVLSVAGAGRWVLEIKAPSIDITQDTIEQAISYARHPEVSGTYAAVLNGKRFLVMHNSQRSSDTPKLDLEVSSPEELAAKVRGLLSPAAIRRDCSPPKVDVGHVLADGFRSSAVVSGGYVRYTGSAWVCNIDLPDDTKAENDERIRRLRDYRVDITGGCIWRDSTSRIRAKLVWGAPHDAIMQFAHDKKLMDAEYVSLDKEISTDPSNPSAFDVVGKLSVFEGEQIFDLHRWEQIESGVALSMTYRGQAIGHLEENIFSGSFQSDLETICPMPQLNLQMKINMCSRGAFKIELDPR